MDDFLYFENIGFPQKGQKLFISEFTFGETSQIGWSTDSEYQFFGYVSGYKEVADDVIRCALTKENVGILDRYVYPIGTCSHYSNGTLFGHFSACFRHVLLACL